MQTVALSLSSSIDFILEIMQSISKWLGRTVTTCISEWLQPAVSKITQLFGQAIDNPGPQPIVIHRAMQRLNTATGNTLPPVLLQIIFDYSIHDIIEWGETHPTLLEENTVESQILTILQNDTKPLPVKIILTLAKCPQRAQYELPIIAMLLRLENDLVPDFQLSDLCKLGIECPYQNPRWFAYIHRQFAHFTTEAVEQQSTEQLIASYNQLSTAYGAPTRLTLLHVIEQQLLANNSERLKSLTPSELGELAVNNHCSAALSMAIYNELDDNNYMRFFDAKALARFFLHKTVSISLLKKIQNELIRGNAEKLRLYSGSTLSEIVAASIVNGIWRSNPSFMKAIQVELLRNDLAKLRSCTPGLQAKLQSAFSPSILFDACIRQLSQML